ncbi:barstar family protein [Phytohabitans aurantiacus]|uniref:barstar family protein n=1 Tax=Phytohabitans aurantiacus TaxID=3016789 RepID=UPI0024921EB0|nr:hypothetical protein [Phytohabitans aurantiacus]
MPVFDDSVRGTHPEDFLLLNAGHIHLYRHRWSVDRLLADLTALDYAAIYVDLATCGDADAVRDAVIEAVPDWPAGYGRASWDGFADGLADHLLHDARPLAVVVLAGFDLAPRQCASDSLVLLDLLASMARWHLLFGRRLICLIKTDEPDLQLRAVGAEHVAWNRHEQLMTHRTSARRPPRIP